MPAGRNAARGRGRDRDRGRPSQGPPSCASSAWHRRETAWRLPGPSGAGGSAPRSGRVRGRRPLHSPRAPAARQRPGNRSPPRRLRFRAAPQASRRRRPPGARPANGPAPPCAARPPPASCAAGWFSGWQSSPRSDRARTAGGRCRRSSRGTVPYGLPHCGGRRPGRYPGTSRHDCERRPVFRVPSGRQARGPSPRDIAEERDIGDLHQSNGGLPLFIVRYGERVALLADACALRLDHQRQRVVLPDGDGPRREVRAA